MNKPILSFVEIMVTQACNISCHGCTNYSDLSHAGYLTWEQGKKQIEPWLDRVEILDFGILGGEPLINPDIRNWIVGLRELLPNAQIRFTTNGLLLEKHYDVVQLLSDIGNSVFKITMHTNTTSVEKIIEKISAEYDWELVTEHGINRMKTKNNFRFQVNRPKVFIKSYVGTYPDIKPHHNNPVESFAICNQQMCPLMYNGKIYKCSTSGLLEDTLRRFNNPNFDLWRNYIPQGLLPTCSDDDLHIFLDDFGNPNAICGQCPSNKDTSSHVNHLTHVTMKKNWI